MHPQANKSFSCVLISFASSKESAPVYIEDSIGSFTILLLMVHWIRGSLSYFLVNVEVEQDEDVDIDTEVGKFIVSSLQRNWKFIE